MSRSNGWVPMPEVTDRTEGVISVGYTGMPSGMDSASLELNIKALHRGVIGWGGFQDVTLAAYDGDEDKYDIGGGGVDETGTGYATGAVAVTKAETSSHDSTSDKYLDYYNVRNGTLDVRWNINALNSRIETHEQFDPSVRAKQLDREIRKTALKGVWEHNTTDMFRNRDLDTFALYAVIDAVFLAGVIQGAILKDYDILKWQIGSRFALMNALRVVMPSSRNIRHLGLSWSDMINDPLFFSARPTRGAIAAGSLATSRLVRPAKTME